LETLTYKMMGVAGAAQVAVTMVSVDQITIDEIIAGTAAAILEDPANLIYTDANGKVRLTPEEQTGATIPDVLVTASVTDPVTVDLPSVINSNFIQIDGQPLNPHATGCVPADQRAYAGFPETGYDAVVESGGTTTSCVLSATGLPLGFSPADPPRGIRFLDGDAAGEISFTVSWTPGTRTLTFSPALGIAPSVNSHIKLGEPQKIDGLGSVASVTAPVTVSGGTITTVTNPVTAGTITDKTGYALAAAGFDQVVVETGINARQALAPILAASAGVLSGSGGSSILIKAGGDPATTRITASVDGEGNRNAVTLNLPS
jgi:hypothetical protein